MKKKSSPYAKLANLTFYNPREEEFSPQSNSKIEKSQKFYRSGTSKEPASRKSVTSPPATYPLQQRTMSQTEDHLNKVVIALDHDVPVTGTTVQTVQEGIDLSPIRIVHGNSQSFGISKIYKFSDKSLEKLPSNLRFKDSTDRSIERNRKEENRVQEEGELSKVYKSAHLFQNLKITREKDEIARLKLSEDKASNVSAQLDAVRADVSHIFNYRPARIKSPGQTFLPEVKERQGLGLSKIFKDSGSGAQNNSLETSYAVEKRNNSLGYTLSSSMGPVTPIRILDNNLQESKFFGTSTPHGSHKSFLFGALQRDIHSVQSPLSRNSRIQARSNDRSIDKVIEPMQTTMTGFDTGEYSPFQSLKKEIPSVFTNAPANRQELVQLGSWLNSTLKGIKENTGLTSKEKFYKADEIYNICFNELIRQVSVECMERGELLMVVWKAYLSLAEDIIDDIKLREDKADERGQKEVEKVHKMYNEILGTKEKLIDEQQQKIDEFDVLVKELNEKIKGFDEKEAVKSNEISKLKEGITKVKKNYMHIQQEQRDLLYKYNRLKKNFDQVEDESLPDNQPIRRKESLNFSFSSDSDEKSAKEPTAFGNPRHKIIRYAEKSIMYEPPVGLGDISTQTDLVLASERYDRIFQTQIKLENILLDDIAKSKLIQSAEMMENLTDKSTKRQRKSNKLDGSKFIMKEDVSKIVTSVDNDVTAGEDFVEEEGDRKSISNGDILLVGDISISNSGGMPNNESINGIPSNKNPAKSRGTSKTKGVARKMTDNRRETSQEEEADKEEIVEEKEGEPKKGKEKSKNIERTKEKRNSSKVQTSSPSKEAQSGTPQNKSPPKKEAGGKTESPLKPKAVKNNNLPQKTSGVKKTGKGTQQSAEGQDPTTEDAIEDEKGNTIYEIKLTEEIALTEQDSQRVPRGRKTNADLSFVTDTGIAKPGTAGADNTGSDPSVRKNAKGSDQEGETLQKSQFASQGETGSPQDLNRRVKHSHTVNLGPSGVEDLTNNPEKFMEKTEDRIIQLMNMYKIEKQKQEELNEENRDLEGQVAKNKIVIKNLQELVEELQRRLDAGEQNKENLKRNDSRKVTVIDESRKRLGHAGTMQMSDSSSTKNLMNLNDSTMDFLQQASFYRSNLGITTTSALARKNQILDKRNYAWQAMLMKAQKAIQAKSNNIADTMPLKSLLKQITSFYAEKIQLAKDSPVTKEQDMATFVYKQFLHTYGFQHFAMRKFLKFMDSVKKYSTIHRVGQFGRMLCIASDETNYQHDEVKQYLLGTEYLMTNSTVGVFYPNADYDKRHFIAYVRAVEYTRVFGEKRMSIEEMLEIKRNIESRKLFDPTGRNPQGVVDMDEVLEKVIDKYKELIEQSKEILQPVFMAGDPYGQKGIVYIEFAMLYRTIEGEKHDEKKIEDAFASNCDVIVNGEIALSFEKFVRVCFDLDLFSKRNQENFLGILNQRDMDSKLDELRVKWRKEKQSLLELVDKNKPFVPQEVGNTWLNSLIWIEDKIREAESSLEKQAVMLKYKVLSKDLSN